jgi:hypothetical protein
MSGSDITETGISIEDSASSVQLFGSIIIQCEKGINVAGDDVSIDGVEIIHGSDDGIHITATASDVILANNIIHSNGGNGIQVSGLASGTNQFYGNTIYDNGNTEFRIVSSYNLDIYENTISDSEFGYGIHLTDGSDNEIYGR